MSFRAAQTGGRSTLVIIFFLFLVTTSHLTLCNPMMCDPLVCSVHGISQAKIWSTLPFPCLEIFLTQNLSPCLLLVRQILSHLGSPDLHFTDKKTETRVNSLLRVTQLQMSSLGCNPGHQALGSTHGEMRQVPGLEGEWAHQLSLLTENSGNNCNGQHLLTTYYVLKVLTSYFNLNIYVYIFFSHTDYYKILSRVPHAIQ